MSVCGVCNIQPAKYKCPTCSLPYCSLVCFRPHKEAHATEEALQPLQHPLPPKPVEPLPQAPPTTHIPISPFQTLLDSTELRDLLARHPALKPQLETIYSATIEPSPDQPHPFKAIKGAEGKFRGRHRSRPKGPWTQQQGDESALRLISEARIDRGELNQEGMREFIKLVALFEKRLEDTQPNDQVP